MWQVHALCAALLGREPSEGDLKTFMDEIDSNKDGLVSFEEFMDHVYGPGWTVEGAPRQCGMGKVGLPGLQLITQSKSLDMMLVSTPDLVMDNLVTNMKAAQAVALAQTKMATSGMTDELSSAFDAQFAEEVTWILKIGTGHPRGFTSSDDASSNFMLLNQHDTALHGTETIKTTKISAGNQWNTIMQVSQKYNVSGGKVDVSHELRFDSKHKIFCWQQEHV